jgi:HTTM domain
MRRFLSPIILSLTNNARSLAEEWNAFWYQPADPTLLGAIRILTGLMLLYTHAVWGLVLGQFFGAASWLSAGLVRAIQQDQYTYSFWWLVPDTWMWHAYGLSMAVLLLFTVGLWTRLTSILSFVVVVSFAHRVPEAMFGLDQINGMLSLYLAIGPSGQALSLDRVIARWRQGSAASRTASSAGANLALRLINVHMCVIYFFAGISKLQGESWWTGEAMWRALSNLEYQSIDMTWLAGHPWLLNLLTHVSVLWELSFCALIWRPRLRPFMLVMAVLLHVGIGACLGMWTFGLIMLVGCASFLPAEGVANFVASLAPNRSRSRLAQSPFLAKPQPAISWSDRAQFHDREPALMADSIGHE